MDWKAIESNEQALRDSMAASLAEGTEEALSFYAATELQLGLLRPWLVWLAKHRKSPLHAHLAIILNLASLIAETAVNSEWHDSSGIPRDPEQVIIYLAKSAAEQALILYREGADRELIFGTPIDLEGRPDA